MSTNSIGTMSVICIPLTMTNLYDDEAQLTSLEILKILVHHSNDSKQLVRSSAYTIVKDLSTKLSVSSIVRRSAASILSLLDSSSFLQSSTTGTNNVSTNVPTVSISSVLTPPTTTSTSSSTNTTMSNQNTFTKKELRNIQINMDNLLGNKYEEDLYIKALLLTDTITSVTIDRKRELLLCYTYETVDITSQLYTILQDKCNMLRDGQGKSRIDIRSLNHATYLDDDDDDKDSMNNGGKNNDENDDNFFGAIVSKGSVVTKEKSAAERLREKDTANGNGGGGWFSSLTSWW